MQEGTAAAPDGSHVEDGRSDAGVSLQNGLHAAAAGAIIDPLFCTSRQISTGPSSSLAAVAGGAVLVTGLGGDRAAQLVAAIAIGALFLLFALFRLDTAWRELARATGLALHLARVKSHVLVVLRADGVVELIGADRTHRNVHRAVVAHLAHTQ